MFSRRTMLARLRNATVMAAVPTFVNNLWCRTAHTQETTPSADQADGFAIMPFDNYPYGAPPLTFGERHGVTVIVKTDAALVESLVPAPLIPAGSELMIQQHMNTIKSPLHVTYPNATVIVPVTLGDTSGFYMARVYEGSGQATMLTIWGREIWGFPKIAADTNVLRQGNATTSYVRAGLAQVDVVLHLQLTEQIEPANSLSLYCRKTIPWADNSGPDLDRIIQVPWRHTPETRISGKVERIDVELDVRGTAVKLPVEGVTGAFWFAEPAGTILDKGQVVHDYLA